MVHVSLIYCVEDDASIRELIGYALESQNFAVKTMADSHEFWQAMESEKPDLVLLDIMLPGESGLSILSRLRDQAAYKTLPVIMLTAKTSEFDIAKGLNEGADDYVKKPFGIVELTSRIHAVLRRCQARKEMPHILECGPIRMDEERHEVTVNGMACPLTVKEFELLRYMMINQNIVLTRERIMEAVWGFSYEGETRTIDMHIRSLRQKLGTNNRIIYTIRGVGYVLKN